MSDEIINYQNYKGTIQEFTVHDSHQQNGVAEREMCTQAEQACALFLSSGLSHFLWEEAMHHTAWIVFDMGNP